MDYKLVLGRFEFWKENDMLCIQPFWMIHCLTETNSCKKYLKERRAELIKQKQVVNGEFVKDVTFTSLSTAAGCILGASVNGKDLWLYPDGKSFKERN